MRKQLCKPSSRLSKSNGLLCSLTFDSCSITVVSSAEMIVGRRDTSSQMHSCWQEARVRLPAFSVAMKSGPRHQNRQLSWRPRKAQQLCWGGSRLEELHVVLWDEASLSIQSPLQPARLLRWMNCTGRGERVRRDEVMGRARGGCAMHWRMWEVSLGNEYNCFLCNPRTGWKQVLNLLWNETLLIRLF